MPNWCLWVLVSIIVLLMTWVVISLRQIYQLKMRLSRERELQYVEIIRTIDHLRHDWMNDIQVLFGYIQLNKQDMLRNYMEKMVEQMRLEGLISKLGIPFLIAYLINFRANTNNLILSVKLEQEISLGRFGGDGVSLARVIIDFIEAYKAHTGLGEGETNQLMITMDVWGDQLFIAFEYDGYSDQVRLRDNLEEIIERIQERHDVQVTMEDNEHSIDMEVRARIADT